MSVVQAEVRKLITLPASLIAALTGIGGSAAITVLNAGGMRSDGGAGGSVEIIEAASNSMLIATVGAVILGVVVATSEYAATDSESGGGRQITTTLLASPRRWPAYWAKAVVVAVGGSLIALAAWAANIALAQAIIGHLVASPSAAEIARQGALEVLYATLMGLMAFGIGALVRSGPVPLGLLILNSSVVSFSLLLTAVTPLAFWLPDAAGRAMLTDLSDFPMLGQAGLPAGFGPLTGGIAMAAWTVALVAVGQIAFLRRDA